MSEEEKSLLLEIHELYTALNRERQGSWNGTYRMKPNGHTYQRNAEILSDKIFDLFNEFRPDYLSATQLDAILHTCNKEVQEVSDYYDQSVKRNAAKIQHTEFLDSMANANDRIEMDIFSVLKAIEEIKREE